MPELPEVERVRLALAPALTGVRFARVTLHRGDLRQPFPPRFAQRLRGQTVAALQRRGKYLLATLSSGETLLMHLGMSGSFRIESSAVRRRTRGDRELDLEHRHDHVVFEMSSGITVTFNDPRRFGVMDLIPAGGERAHAALGRMGPEPLARGFDAAALAARCAGRRTTLKVALLDQRVVAGLGNIYASEALHRAGLSPFRPASTLANARGGPTPAAKRLVAAIRTVLRSAIRPKPAPHYRGSRFRVYDRAGDHCPRRGCTGTIERAWQAGRSTFYCPVCQR
jgi:formamidopyrimidine-DNA glycosylase